MKNTISHSNTRILPLIRSECIGIGELILLRNDFQASERPRWVLSSNLPRKAEQRVWRSPGRKQSVRLTPQSLRARIHSALWILHETCWTVWVVDKRRSLQHSAKSSTARQYSAFGTIQDGWSKWNVLNVCTIERQNNENRRIPIVIQLFFLLSPANES